MSNIVHVPEVSEEKEDFECDGIGDTGGNMERTRRFSQEVRGNKCLDICLYFFQIIRICVRECFLYLRAQIILFHFTNQLWSLCNRNTSKNFHKLLVLNISLLFLKAASDIKGGSPFLFSLMFT